MNVKERRVPPIILQEQALLRRLPHLHPKRGDIEKSLIKRWAGYRGEQSLDYELKILPYREYHIFHDLRLRVYGSSFQIDTLILTPQVGFIIEVKNIAGILSLDGDEGQFLRTLYGKKERLPNPLAQVKAQTEKLKQWLHFQKIYSYPIHPLIAIANTGARLDFMNTSVPVTHLEETVEMIKSLYIQYETRRSFDLKTISQPLLQNHLPLHSNITSAYSISSSEILKGIQCPGCHQYSMLRVRRLWECPSCNHRSSQAHRQAIADYFLLLNSTLTNKECCTFFELPSQQIVTKLLKRLNLPYTGLTKGRKYLRPDDIEGWLKK
ncbi:nuclease-related domain-containing protein [Pontibacillus salipaludis]|uniref:nuclease-related domain-containing protein n=1 Tax=Pontibacillus salipaludis TaxID=1697394 RepID=UPI0031EB8F6E